MVPAEQLDDFLFSDAIAELVSEQHGRGAITEQSDAYPDLVVLMYGIELGPDKGGGNFAGQHQDAGRLAPETGAKSDVGGRPKGSQAAGAANAMEQDLFDGRAQAELLHDMVIVTRVGRVGARGCHNMGNLRQMASPLGDGLATRRHGQVDAVVEEDVAELRDGWRIFAVDQRVVNVAYTRATVDAGEFVDREHLV